MSVSRRKWTQLYTNFDNGVAVADMLNDKEIAKLLQVEEKEIEIPPVLSRDVIIAADLTLYSPHLHY